MSRDDGVRISKYTLARNGQTLILRGMSHVAPAGLYGMLQTEMDACVGEGYKVFFEGLRDYSKLGEDASPQEYKIAEFLTLLIDSYPIMAKAWGFGLQKEYIKYPSDAINADISFSELVRILKERNFRCDFLSAVLKQGLADGEAAKEKLSKIDPFRKPRKGFAYFISWLLFFRKLLAVVLSHRNEVAVDIIEKKASGENLHKIFIHYGEGHVAGMIRLFKRHGWRVVGISELDLSSFR